MLPSVDSRAAEAAALPTPTPPYPPRPRVGRGGGRAALFLASGIIPLIALLALLAYAWWDTQRLPTYQSPWGPMQLDTPP